MMKSFSRAALIFSAGAIAASVAMPMLTTTHKEASLGFICTANDLDAVYLNEPLPDGSQFICIDFEAGTPAQVLFADLIDGLKDLSKGDDDAS